MSTIVSIFIPAGSFDFQVIEIEQDKVLDECYKAINCRCIDIVTGSFTNDGQFPVNIVIDDEGLLKEDATINPIAWYLYSKLEDEHPIVGNVLLFDNNNKGDLTSVTDLMLQGVEMLRGRLPYLFPEF